MDSPISESCEPLFFKHNELVDAVKSDTLDIKPYDVCVSAAKITGHNSIDGAQHVRGLWRIYFKTRAARLELLVRKKLNISSFWVNLYDKNPFVTKQQKPLDRREKITIKDIPISIAGQEIEDYLKSKTVKLTSDIRYANERDHNRQLTSFKNGDRYVYAIAPIVPILDREAIICGKKCRVFHDGQFTKMCKCCNDPGHFTGADNCPGLNNGPEPITFSSYRMPLSNCYNTDITIFNNKFNSIQQAWLWRKATDLDKKDLAKDIKTAKHAGIVTAIGKHLSEDKDWDSQHTSTMKQLMRAKVEQCKEFKNIIMETEDTPFAAAITDPYWRTGLSLKLTKITKPSFWPGNNMLGVLLAEIRQELQDKTRHHNNVRNTDSNSKNDTLTDADDSIENTETYDMISEFDANETLNNNDNTITCDPDDDLTSSQTSSLDINSVITATTNDNTSSDRSRRIHRTPARRRESNSAPSQARNHSKTKSDTCTSSKTHQDTLDEFLRKRKQSATPPNTKQTKTYRKDDGKNYPIAASDTGS